MTLYLPIAAISAGIEAISAPYCLNQHLGCFKRRIDPLLLIGSETCVAGCCWFLGSCCSWWPGSLIVGAGLGCQIWVWSNLCPGSGICSAKFREGLGFRVGAGLVNARAWVSDLHSEIRVVVGLGCRFGSGGLVRVSVWPVLGCLFRVWGDGLDAYLACAGVFVTMPRLLVFAAMSVSWIGIVGLGIQFNCCRVEYLIGGCLIEVWLGCLISLDSPPIAAVALGGWYHSITPLLQRWLGVFDWVWVLGVWRWFCLNFIKIMKRSESQSRSQPAVAYGLAQSYPVCCGAQIIGGHAAFQRGRIAPMAQASSTSGGKAALDFNIFWKCFFKCTKKNIFSSLEVTVC